MILNVEKIHAIKFQQLVMVPLGNTKAHYVALYGNLNESFYYSNIDLGHPL
jgi:hypothetical protein